MISFSSSLRPHCKKPPCGLLQALIAGENAREKEASGSKATAGVSSLRVAVLYC